MKDTYSAPSAPATERMLPAQGSFTRPRRFLPDEAAEETEVRHVDLVIDQNGQAVASPHETARAVTTDLRDLWNVLHHQDPGEDQQVIPTGQAAEAYRISEVSRAFDLLRTRLRQTVKQHGWMNIGVVSPTAGCGNTFTATHLAASLSRVPSTRTVLMDFNMRTPGVAQALDLDGSRTGDLRDFLAGDVAISDYMLRVTDTLAVGLNDTPQADAAEVLQDPATLESLREMRSALRPDLVLYDLPPMLLHDDASAFLPQLDGVLLVSDGTQTMARHIAACERMLDGQVPLLGVILNRARASSIARF